MLILSKKGLKNQCNMSKKRNFVQVKNHFVRANDIFS